MSERCSHCEIETAKHHQQWVNVSEMHLFDKNHENCDSFKKRLFLLHFTQIGCDNCPRWFHDSCWKMDEEEVNDAKQTATWKCPVCTWVMCFRHCFSNVTLGSIKSKSCIKKSFRSQPNWTTFSSFVKFENGFIALVWIKSIGLCQSIFPFWAGWNKYDAEKLAWRRTIFRKIYKKFVAIFHRFFPICQVWKWVHCIGIWYE